MRAPWQSPGILVASLALCSALVVLWFNRYDLRLPDVHQNALAEYWKHNVTFDKPAPKSKVAYATFLSGADTNQDVSEGYFLGARVMAYQLLHSQTAGKIPFLVLVTHDISRKKRQRLEKDGAIVLVVEHIPKPDWMQPSAARWRELMTKLRIFELTEYEKICYMDSDILILGNMDGVFKDEAAQTQQTNDEWPDIEGIPPPPQNYLLAAHCDSAGYDHPFPPDQTGYLNGGFLVFAPSQAMLDYYLMISKIEGLFDSEMMEQNLLNYVHRWGGNMPWKRLQTVWNINFPVKRDHQEGVKSFHDKFWETEGPDETLAGIWREQKAEMLGYWRGKENAGHV